MKSLIDSKMKLVNEMLFMRVMMVAVSLTFVSIVGYCVYLESSSIEPAGMMDTIQD